MGSKPSKHSDEDVAVGFSRPKAAARSNNNRANDSISFESSSVSHSPEGDCHLRARGTISPRPADRRQPNTIMISRHNGGGGGAAAAAAQKATVADGDDREERTFRQERVARVPTRAVLKPPKQTGSNIANPEDDEDEYDIY